MLYVSDDRKCLVCTEIKQQRASVFSSFVPIRWIHEKNFPSFDLHYFSFLTLWKNSFVGRGFCMFSFYRLAYLSSFCRQKHMQKYFSVFATCSKNSSLYSKQLISWNLLAQTKALLIAVLYGIKSMHTKYIRKKMLYLLTKIHWNWYLNHAGSNVLYASIV